MTRLTRTFLLAMVVFAIAPVSQRDASAQMLHDRTHPEGVTLLRFHRDRMHLAMVFDTVPTSIAERGVVLADGRTIEFRWSGRSAWIAGKKFELPFGPVFLVSTKDSVRVKQLEFKAVRSRVVLDQMESSPVVASWVATHGDTLGDVARQDIDASTMPRYTLEVAEWKFRGGHALTCILSGEPQFVIVSPVPVTLQGSGSTAFGGFEHINVWIGTGDEAVMWTSKQGSAALGDLSFDYANGRVFLHTGGANVQQVNTPLTLSAAAAEQLSDEIEKLQQVRTHLGLE